MTSLRGKEGRHWVSLGLFTQLCIDVYQVHPENHYKSKLLIVNQIKVKWNNLLLLPFKVSEVS